MDISLKLFFDEIFIARTRSLESSVGKFCLAAQCKSMLVSQERVSKVSNLYNVSALVAQQVLIAI